MPEPKMVPVFTVRMPANSTGLVVVGRAEFMMDAGIDRRLLVAILKHAIASIEGGAAPEVPAKLRL